MKKGILKAPCGCEFEEHPHDSKFGMVRTQKPCHACKRLHDRWVYLRRFKGASTSEAYTAHQRVIEHNRKAMIDCGIKL